MTITSAVDVVRRILTDKPSFHLSGAARWDALPGTLEAIRKSVRVSDVTLEVGAGVSTVVFAAAGAQHTAVSPDPSEHQLIRNYCRRIGVDDGRLKFIVGLSDDILPSYLTRERTLDVALIDGAHSFPVPIVDWYYVSRALKVGGKLLLDDIPVPAVAPAFRHMTLEPGWRLEGIFDSRAAEFTLLAAPTLRDDWLAQPFNGKYPDYSFAGIPRSVRLRAIYHMRCLRSATGRRYPALRHIYKRTRAT
jgi:Methyltransferase domain